jgi:hypothetical protein
VQSQGTYDEQNNSGVPSRALNKRTTSSPPFLASTIEGNHGRQTKPPRINSTSRSEARVSHVDLRWKHVYWCSAAVDSPHRILDRPDIVVKVTVSRFPRSPVRQSGGVCFIWFRRAARKKMDRRNE